LHAYVEAYATVEPEPPGAGEPGGGAQLASAVDGIVSDVPISEGQAVRAGDLVIHLDDRIPQAAVNQASKEVEVVQAMFDREKILFDQQNTSIQRFQEAQRRLSEARATLASAQGRLALFRLTTPMAGVVTEIRVRPGQSVQPGIVVAEIVNDDRLVLTAQVPFREAGQLELGQEVRIPAVHGASTAVAHVSFISPRVDPRTAAVLVRASVSAEAGLRAGQFVRVRIVTEEHKGCLAVPREAIYTDPEGRATFHLVEGDRAREATVRVGLRDRDLVEIEGVGVSEGATVVTLGSYALPDGTKVRVKE
jgi:RND family efflux transporter MFP subunit